MEADAFKYYNLIQYSTVNQYHIAIQMSFTSTLLLSLQCSSKDREKTAGLQCLVIGVKEDKEGAEAMRH